MQPSRPQTLRLLLGLLAGLLLAGCAQLGRPGAPVRGQVKFTGPVPPPRSVALPNHLRPLFPEGLNLASHRVSPDGGLAEALVYVVNPPTNLPAVRLPAATLLISNTVCYPRVLAVQTNQPVHFRSEGEFLLNLSATPRVNQGFNFAIARSGQEHVRQFHQPELNILIADNVHPWLTAQVSVFAHPWFAVTDAEGRFELPPLPPGRYELEARHRRSGATRRLAVEVKRSAPAELVFSLPDAQSASAR